MQAAKRRRVRNYSGSDFLPNAEARREMEFTSGFWPAFHPDPAIHELHKTRADSEAKAGAAIGAGHRTVSLREGIEDSGLLVLGDAYPCVGDSELQFARVVVARDLSCTHDNVSLFSEFDRVPHQVCDDLPHSAWVTY